MFNYPADFPFTGEGYKQLLDKRLNTENYVSVNDLIWPIFVVEGENKIEPISELPGINRYSIDKLLDIASSAFELGIKCVVFISLYSFKLKSENCEEAYNPDNLVNKATRF